MGDNSSYYYSIKNVPFIRQKGMTCWAAAGAMMLSWKKRKSLSLSSAMQECRGVDVDGTLYTDYFKNGRKLPYSEFSNFGYSLGMQAAGARSFTALDMRKLMMKRNSPLMVCVLWNGANISHFYVITMFYTDEDDNECLMVNDSNREEPDTPMFFGDFIEAFENAAASAQLNAQVLYY